MIRVGVIGATGFLGAEAVRLIHVHPEFDLHFLGGGESAGRPFSDIRSGFRGVVDTVVESPDPDVIAERCDVAILALPHGASAAIAEQLLERDLVVVDLGSDFRIKDRQVSATMYGREAPRQVLLDRAFYSLPELTGPPPNGTRLIASPGCFATGLNLLLAPLAKANLLPNPPTVFGVTGSSGSGIAPAPGVHHSLRTTNFVSYKSLRHQHLGEVQQLLTNFGFGGALNFVPHSAPMVRGIHLTLVLTGVATSQIEAAFRAHYASHPMLSLIQGPTPIASVAGTNRVVIGFESAGDDSVVTLAMDNLLKGGSGQAIQSLNLLYGFPEATALPMIGVWP